MLGQRSKEGVASNYICRRSWYCYAGTPQKKAIENDKLIGSVTQSPLMMGYKTIYTLVDICNGKDVKDIPMDGYWYTKENMNDDDIAPNLYD